MDTLRNAVHHAMNMSRVRDQILQRVLGWSDSSGSDFYAAVGLDLLTTLFALIVLPLCSLIFFIRRSTARNLIVFVVAFIGALSITYNIPHKNLKELALAMILLVLALFVVNVLFSLVLLLARRLEQNVGCRFTWPPFLSSLLYLALVMAVEDKMLGPFQRTPLLFLFFSFLCVVLQLVLLRDIVSDFARLFPMIRRDVHNTRTLLAVVLTWAIYFHFETRALQHLKAASPPHASFEIEPLMTL